MKLKIRLIITFLSIALVMVSCKENNEGTAEEFPAIEHYLTALELLAESDSAWVDESAMELKPNYQPLVAAALLHLDSSLQLDPEASFVYLLKSHVYMRKKQYNEALQVFDQALQYIPDDYLIYMERGKVLDSLERPEEARASYLIAFQITSEKLEENHHDFQSMMDKVIIMGYLKEYDAALSFIEEERSHMHQHNEEFLDELEEMINGMRNGR